LQEMVTAFETRKMDILLLLADKDRALGFPGPGDFFCEADGQLTPRGEATSAPWAYAGVRLIKPQLYDGAPIAPYSAKKIWAPLYESARIRGHTMDRFWLHVGTPEALEDAQMWLTSHGES